MGHGTARTHAAAAFLLPRSHAGDPRFGGVHPGCIGRGRVRVLGGSCPGGQRDRRHRTAREPVQHRLGRGLAGRYRGNGQGVVGRGVLPLVADGHAPCGRRTPHRGLRLAPGCADRRALGQSADTADPGPVPQRIAAGQSERRRPAPAVERFPLCVGNRRRGGERNRLQGRLGPLLAPIDQPAGDGHAEPRLRQRGVGPGHRQPDRLRDILPGKAPVLPGRPGCLHHQPARRPGVRVPRRLCADHAGQHPAYRRQAPFPGRRHRHTGPGTWPAHGITRRPQGDG